MDLSQSQDSEPDMATENKPKKSVKKRVNGKRCCVASCDNIQSEGFSLHTFPKDPKTCASWIRFVKSTRKDFTVPNIYSVICSVHFEKECYPLSIRLKRELGFTTKCDLIPGSVPTIYPKKKELRQSTHDYFNDAFVFSPPGPAAKTKPKANSTPKPTSNISTDSDFGPSPKKKVKISKIYMENRRALFEIVNNHQEKDQPANSDDIAPIPGDSIDTAVETVEENTKKTTDASFQINIDCRPKRSNVRVQVKPATKDRCIQTELKPKFRSIGTQCEILPTSMSDLTEKQVICDGAPSPKKFINAMDEIDPPVKEAIDDDYHPSSSSEESLGSTISDDFPSVPKTPVTDNKYLVFESRLLELFKICVKCGKAADGEVKRTVGTMVRIQQYCDWCGHTRVWNSQPYVRDVPAGNLLLSAAVLFSGSTPAKALRMMTFMKVASISSETFFRHQRYILHPVITFVWSNHQQHYVRCIQERGGTIKAGGDGRADTPGHSAKYGSYSIMDLEQGVIIDVQLVQSNEVKSSSHMEKEGLIRCVEYLDSNNITMTTLVTDRHVQIVKWVRENLPNVAHLFDVWHVSKGLKKKLLKLSKEKECDSVGAWIKSLTNHVYWCAASTPEADGELMEAKWLSVCNHIQNIHSGHGTLFPTCSHGPISRRTRRKKWFKPGTKACEKLMDILQAKRLVKDIRKLSGSAQTSEVEAFHSTINHFAPKMMGFSYYGMLCRLLLAAMHFNENSRRNCATTADGRERYAISFPKFKKGEHSVHEIKVDCTYDYVNSLMEVAFDVAAKTRLNDHEGVRLPLEAVPPPLCANYSCPDKWLAVEEKTSRYRKETCV